MCQIYKNNKIYIKRSKTETEDHQFFAFAFIFLFFSSSFISLIYQKPSKKPLFYLFFLFYFLLLFIIMLKNDIPDDQVGGYFNFSLLFLWFNTFNSEIQLFKYWSSSIILQTCIFLPSQIDKLSILDVARTKFNKVYKKLEK